MYEQSRRRIRADRIRRASTAAAPITSLIRVVVAAPITSLIRVVAAAPTKGGGEQEELATRPVRKTQEPATTLRARRKVAWEDDSERT